MLNLNFQVAHKVYNAHHRFYLYQMKEHRARKVEKNNFFFQFAYMQKEMRTTETLSEWLNACTAMYPLVKSRQAITTMPARTAKFQILYILYCIRRRCQRHTKLHEMDAISIQKCIYLQLKNYKYTNATRVV